MDQEMLKQIFEKMNELGDELAKVREVRVTAQGPGTRITVADLATKAIDALSEGTARTYGTYMRFLAHGDPAVTGPDGRPFTGYGHMWADEILPSHLVTALELVERRRADGAARRAHNRQLAGRVVRDTRGMGAQYNAVGAWRNMFETAIKDRHLAEGMNPAAKVKKPKRLDGQRMALEPEHYQQMVRLISFTGDDPELDALALRFLDITGARREGLLNLDLAGIDEQECTVRLDEKFGMVIDQPVPDWFIAELLDFARSRGAVKPQDQVFVKRTRSGALESMGARRFDYIFTDRLQSSFEWADRLQVTAHTIRHHAITRIERHAGGAVAGAFARHLPQGVTDIYARASRREVATAVVGLFGGDHPWLHRQPRQRR